jgi:hypothetical protein
LGDVVFAAVLSYALTALIGLHAPIGKLALGPHFAAGGAVQLRERIWLDGDLSYQGGWRTGADPHPSAGADAWDLAVRSAALGVRATLRRELPEVGLSLSAGMGPRLAYSWVRRTSTLSATTIREAVRVGGELRGTAGRRMGPGELTLGMGLTLMPGQPGLAAADRSGVLTELGYRLPL